MKRIITISFGMFVAGLVVGYLACKAEETVEGTIYVRNDGHRVHATIEEGWERRWNDDTKKMAGEIARLWNENCLLREHIEKMRMQREIEGGVGQGSQQAHQNP